MKRKSVEEFDVYHKFSESRRILFVGFGGIASSFLPLLMRHFNLKHSQVRVCEPAILEEKLLELQEYQIGHDKKALTEENYESYCAENLSEGDFLINLSVDVCSVALLEWCYKNKVHYIDTCIEPWAGLYTDTSLPIAERSNYALREKMLAVRTKYQKKQSANSPPSETKVDDYSNPTILVANGANPGLVSYLTKEAMVILAKDYLKKCKLNRQAIAAADLNILSTIPETKEEWGQFAQCLGVKVIHIAERDTQIAKVRKEKGVFVNTWSIDGFCSEGRQPAELGWGSHENKLPNTGRFHDKGCGSAIYMMQPGAATRVRSYTPQQGPHVGWLITHNESISIADYFCVKDEHEQLLYRPTCHYAYHPCDDAVLSLHELQENNFEQQKKQHYLTAPEIISGHDELGVLLMGGDKMADKSFWYGSLLDIETARQLVPHNNATSLQVSATLLAGMVYCCKHPNQGILEPDEIPFDFMLKIAKPYLGKVVGQYSDWTPLKDRCVLFPEPEVDVQDPWQFANFLI